MHQRKVYHRHLIDNQHIRLQGILPVTHKAIYIALFLRIPADLQEAVDRLPSAGGTVIVPRGEWKSGAIHLKSNVKLYLEEGCVIHFSSCMEDYLPPVFTRWEGVECYNYSPLIYAADCENVTICGTGVLDGAGSAWWHWKKLQQNAADRLRKVRGLW